MTINAMQIGRGNKSERNVSLSLTDSSAFGLLSVLRIVTLWTGTCAVALP